MHIQEHRAGEAHSNGSGYFSGDLHLAAVPVSCRRKPTARDQSSRVHRGSGLVPDQSNGCLQSLQFSLLRRMCGAASERHEIVFWMCVCCPHYEKPSTRCLHLARAACLDLQVSSFAWRLLRRFLKESASAKAKDSSIELWSARQADCHDRSTGPQRSFTNSAHVTL